MTNVVRKPLLIVWFAGGGGSSVGIAQATGDEPDYALNHNATALGMHAANHPETVHLCEDAHAPDPRELAAGRAIDLFWASPDCRDFSRAKGGAPRSPRIRGLAWTLIPWAKLRRPRVIILENVPEFRDWGPVYPEGHARSGEAILDRRRETFERFVRRLRQCGYAIEWRELVAADYGAPTTRKRFFLIARCDGLPIVWPVASHAPVAEARSLGLRPWRAAAEIIDWSIPCPSIFDRKRPLAEATLRRIAKGIERYVIGAARPFIVPITHSGHDRVHDSADPLRTITTAHRGEMAAAALHHAYTSNTCGGEGDPSKPAKTITAGGNHHYALQMPLAALDHVERAELHAFLIKYYGSSTGQDLAEPLHSATSRARFGLVIVEGVVFQIVDIGMRMLTSRELFSAQGFPADYVIDRDLRGRPITKTNQTLMAGNAVPPPWAEALTRANLPWRCEPEKRAAA